MEKVKQLITRILGDYNNINEKKNVKAEELSALHAERKAALKAYDADKVQEKDNRIKSLEEVFGQMKKDTERAILDINARENIKAIHKALEDEGKARNEALQPQFDRAQELEEEAAQIRAGLVQEQYDLEAELVTAITPLRSLLSDQEYRAIEIHCRGYANLRHLKKG